MKFFKQTSALILSIVILFSSTICSYAASLSVPLYGQVVYTKEATFFCYDYSASPDPNVTYLTVLATSGVGSGSGLYHVKYIDGKLCYCIQPGAHAESGGNYAKGAGAWTNLPADIQQAIAMTMACGYPTRDYGVASGDTNSSDVILAEKWAATQAIIWDFICHYRYASNYSLVFNASPFVNCVDLNRYPTFKLWYDAISSSLQSASVVPSFTDKDESEAMRYPLEYDSSKGLYTIDFLDYNSVLPSYDFEHLSGNGLTFKQDGYYLHVSATPEAAAKLTNGTTLHTTGSAFKTNPSTAVISWYDQTGQWQAVANFTNLGVDPLNAYLRLYANPNTDLTIHKTDSETGKALSGAVYRLFNDQGTLVGEKTTDTKGNAVFTSLPIGKYTYQETKAPSGYLLDNTIYSCTISGSGNVTIDKKNTPRKASLTIIKTNDEAIPMPGISVTLEVSSDHGVTWKEVRTGTTDASGKLIFDGLTPDLTYRATEVSTNSGYSLMTSPLYEGPLPITCSKDAVGTADYELSGSQARIYDVTINATNNTSLTMPFTGANSLVNCIVLSILLLIMGALLSKSELRRN